MAYGYGKPAGPGRPYTVGARGGSAGGGPYSVGIPGGAGNASGSMAEFWATSYSGRYSADYAAGVAAGQQDIADDSSAGLAALEAIKVRDHAWTAKSDGYREVTKDRGPLPFGPALGSRDSEC